MTKQTNLLDLLNQEMMCEDLLEARHKECKKYLHIVFNTLRYIYCSSNYEQVLKQWKNAILHIKRKL